jgi:hypothetical protein
VTKNLRAAMRVSVNAEAPADTVAHAFTLV